MQLTTKVDAHPNLRSDTRHLYQGVLWLGGLLVFSHVGKEDVWDRDRREVGG